MHHPMKQLPDRAISEDEAREILDLGEYCVVATTDEDGHPCTSTRVPPAVRRPRIGRATRASA